MAPARRLAKGSEALQVHCWVRLAARRTSAAQPGSHVPPDPGGVGAWALGQHPAHRLAARGAVHGGGASRGGLLRARQRVRGRP
eukprot:453758-Alexandrium_andersonii.AAC.1